MLIVDERGSRWRGSGDELVDHPVCGFERALHPPAPSRRVLAAEVNTALGALGDGEHVLFAWAVVAPGALDPRVVLPDLLDSANDLRPQLGEEGLRGVDDIVAARVEVRSG